MKPTIFVINGPNLNMLGLREPHVYGTFTLADLEARVRLYGESLGFNIDCRQSNHEGVLIDWIQEARAGAQGIVLNAGGYTHTSVAIADAILACGKPTIEVHISNVHAREAHRHHSFISPVAAGVIAGLGIEGYEFALQALAGRVVKPDPSKTVSV